MLNITEREAKSILAYCANLLGYDNISAIFMGMIPIYNCVCEKKTIKRFHCYISTKMDFLAIYLENVKIIYKFR